MKPIVTQIKPPSRGMVRLLIAIVISVLLHFFWFKQFSWELPQNKTDIQVIDARLVAIKPTPPQPKEQAKQEEKTSEKPAKPKPKLIEAEPALTPLPPPYVPPVLPAPVPQTLIEEALDTPPAVTEDNEAVEDVFEPSVEQNTSPKALPYQYIETTFDIYLNADKARAGKAKIIYDASESGRYKLSWLVEASGLLALFYPDLLQTSEGAVDAKEGLRPTQYRYQFGDKVDKTYQATFNWEAGELRLYSSKGEKIETLKSALDAQDFLSFMYQFMFKAPLSEMQITLTNGKRLANYDYSFEGEEILKLDFGDVKTYHIKHAKSDSDEKTELWLAVDYQFIPVKISKTEKDDQVITQYATAINTKETQLTQEQTPLP